MPRIINIEPSDTVDTTGHLTLANSAQLTEKDILEVIATVGDTDTTAERAINGLVARRMLDIGLPHGHQIVAAIGAMIRRNLQKVFDETLVDLYASLITTSDASAKIVAGLKLGDRGTHFAAGWLGSRTLRRSMDEDESRRYGIGMAHTGYSGALAAARHYRTSPGAKEVTYTIPQIVTRLPDVVKILAAIDQSTQKRLQTTVPKTMQ